MYIIINYYTKVIHILGDSTELGGYANATYHYEVDLVDIVHFIINYVYYYTICLYIFFDIDILNVHSAFVQMLLSRIDA